MMGAHSNVRERVQAGRSRTLTVMPHDLAVQVMGAALPPVEQDYLDEAQQIQALSFAVHIPLVRFGIAFPSMVLLLEPPSGRAAMAELFRSAGLNPRRSDPGSVADRLIAQLGGL
jgi:hypothetical protein